MKSKLYNMLEGDKWYTKNNSNWGGSEGSG